VKFELTILGCGSAVPTVQRNSAAQVLNVQGRLFLIDCGEGTQQQLRRFKVPYTRINHVFISHLHGDHFFGLAGLLSSFSLQGRRADLHVYADERLQGIIDFLSRAMHSRPRYPLHFHPIGRDAQLLHEDKALTVHSFPLLHRADAPSSGFLFAERPRPRHVRREMTDAFRVPVAFMHRLKQGEDFVTPDGEVIANERLTTPAPAPRSYAYLTDTLFHPDHAEYCKGVDLLYHEATYGDDLARLARETFHSTAGEAARLALLAGAGRLLLGHFSSRYPDPSCLLEQARLVFPDTRLCEDGAVFELPAARREL
jgi:ribonuclease Z